MPGVRNLMESPARSPVFRMVQYRNSAEQLRVIAEKMMHAIPREALLRIAITYDGLADQISAGFV